MEKQVKWKSRFSKRVHVSDEKTAKLIVEKNLGTLVVDELPEVLKERKKKAASKKIDIENLNS